MSWTGVIVYCEADSPSCRGALRARDYISRETWVQTTAPRVDLFPETASTWASIGSSPVTTWTTSAARWYQLLVLREAPVLEAVARRVRSSDDRWTIRG